MLPVFSSLVMFSLIFQPQISMYENVFPEVWGERHFFCKQLPGHDKQESRMKFRILFIFLVISLLLSGCGLVSNNANTGTDATQNYDYASGGQDFSVLLNGVGMQVESVIPRPAERTGYTYLVLTVSLVNESNNPVVPGNFILVDDVSNQYASQQTNVPFGSELTGLPLSVNKGDKGVTGHIVFEVPNSALQANLRLRWESDSHQSRIDIFLGALPAV